MVKTPYCQCKQHRFYPEEKQAHTHKLFLKKEGEGVCRTLGNLSQVVENFKKLRKSFLNDSSSF